MSNHEGYSLGIDVDFSQLEKANKATSALYQALSKVNQRFSGMHAPNGLPSQINHISSVTASYIQRLESEGKTYQANQERVKGYKSAISELASKEKGLESQLVKIAETSGKTSAAYQRQQVRINQNVTEMNKFKSAIESTNDEMKKANPSFLDKVKNKLTETKTEGEKTHSVFKSVFSASVLSNAVTSGFSFVKSKLGEMIQSAHQYNIDQQTMNATWLTLTGNASKGKLMVKQIDDMAAAAQNSTKMVDNLSQKFYAIDKDPTETGKLTKSVLTLQDAFGRSDDQVENFGTQFGQMMANGKVSAQDMLSFVNVFPVLRTELRKTMREQTGNHKLTMKQVNELMSKGQISSNLMIGVLEKTANKYKNATGNFNKTIPGMLRTVKSQLPRLTSAFDQPFTKLENPIIKQVSDWVSSKKTKGAFEKLGKTTSKGVNKVLTNALDNGEKHKSLTSTLNKGIDNFSNSVGKGLDWLANHSKDITTVGKSIFSISKDISKNVWNDFSSILVTTGKAFGLIGKDADKHGGTLHALAEGASNLAKNKTDLKIASDAIVAMLAVKTTKNIASPFLSLGRNAFFFTKGLKGIENAQGLDKAASKFLKRGNIFRSVGKKLGGFVSKGFKPASNTFKGIKDLGIKAGKAANKGFSDSLNFSKELIRNSKDWITRSGTKIKDVGTRLGQKFNAGVSSAITGSKENASLQNSLKGLFDPKIGQGKLGGMLQSTKAAGGFSNLTTAGKVATGAAGLGVAVDAGSAFLDAFKHRSNADKRSVDIGKGIGAGIGGGIGLWVGGPLGAAVGAKVGETVGKWGGQAVNKFTKGWQSNKPPKKVWSIENLGWSTKHTIDTVTKAGRDAVHGVQKGWLSKKPPKKFWSLQTLGFIAHGYWDIKTGQAAVNAAKAVQKGWLSKKPPKSFWSLENFGWSARSMWGGLKSSVNDVIDWFKNKWNGLVDWFDKTKSKLSNFGHSIDLTDSHSNIRKVLSGKTVGAHALGSQGGASHYALVGEAGPEIGYHVNGNHARILGANGPEITKVNSGERILSANDSNKVMAGGLGKGLVLKGYANGNTSLGTNKSTKAIQYFAKNNQSLWSKIASQTSKKTKETRDDTVSKYTAIKKGVNKQMDSLHDGTISLAKSTSKGFGKAMSRMKDYAQDAMKDTIEQINHGISGIDKVLSQFGGNSSVIKPVKFATGSNGQLTNNTLAMVNDAPSGPRQEAIVKQSGDIWLPHGDNRVLPLQKGDAVLNGTQTQDLAHSWGLPHFAKGSGVSHSLLKKIASRGAANPAKSFADMYTSNLKSSGPNIQLGTTDLAKNSGKQFGIPWMNAMWTVIGNAIGDGNGHGGTRESFLKYAEENFSDVRYVMGAASKIASDCSGMVMQALRHFNVDIGRSTVDMQHSSGTEYLGKSLSKTLPGDLVIFGHGTGAAGHVGIIKNPRTGTMFNETPPSARVSRISDDTSMGYGFYRVKGLHDATAKSNNAKPSSRLMSLVKSQLGASALKWIKDKLGDEGSLGGNIGGEGVQRWAGTVKRILGMLNLSTSKPMVEKVLRQIQTESGGNPSAKQAGADPDGDGSGPALGLMQTKRATFNAFKRKGAGNIFNGPDNIYAGLNYAKHRYGSDLSALGNGHGYANGGDPTVGDSVLVGEKGPEIAKFKEPVHVYSHEQSKKLSLDKLLNKVRIKAPKKVGSTAPKVTININGNISSESDAEKYAEIIERRIQDVFENIGYEFGSDPSVY